MAKSFVGDVVRADPRDARHAERPMRLLPLSNDIVGFARARLVGPDRAGHVHSVERQSEAVTGALSGLSISDGFDDSNEGNERGAGIFNRGTLTTRPS